MMVSHLDWSYPREDQGNTSYLSPRGTHGLAVSIIFTNSLAAIFILARMYTRTKLSKRMEANDCMIVVALVFSFAFMPFGFTIPFYNAALLCAKASIIMQYFRAVISGDPSIPSSCLSSKGLWFSNASMHIATDLAILTIPIPALAALELLRK
ncbi:hypothetical protein BDW59DRAFT_172032 [Aspergillus cavernicola]|uniref:Rhodopsin domain-containing protein n=1 Tax=Aspergillus cavernicola TaxID=176166 RepID=A0ABR4IDT0_9EURO